MKILQAVLTALASLFGSLKIGNDELRSEQSSEKNSEPEND